MLDLFKSGGVDFEDDYLSVFLVFDNFFFIFFFEILYESFMLDVIVL